MRRFPAALFLAGALCAALPEQECYSLLGEANTLFRQANETSLRDPAAARELYRRAALRYERIAREGGVRNGKLFYNTGNAWFRAEDPGRAILNYRRAELYIAGDPDLAQNLAYARRRRPDSFEEKQQTRVLRTLLFWHYDLSPRVRARLFVLLSGLFWLGAAFRILRPARLPRSALAAAGVPALLFLASLVAAGASPGGDAGVVLAPQVTARKGDGESYEPAFEAPLHAGTEFRLVEERPEWFHAELPDGRRCWIPAGSAGLAGRL